MALVLAPENAYLVGVGTGMSLIEHRWPAVDKLINGRPLVIVEDGQPLAERMYKARGTEDDVLQRSREGQRIESMEQIKYAILERSGGVSVIRKQKEG